MNLITQFNLSTDKNFQSLLSTLVQLSHERRYTYKDYHTFFNSLIQLLDLGMYHLSVAEFIFYLRRLSQTSVPLEKAIDWFEGSLHDIDAHLSDMNNDDITALANYIFSPPFAKLSEVLIAYQSMASDSKTRSRAATLIDLMNNFAYLILRQLQSRQLSKPCYQLKHFNQASPQSQPNHSKKTTMDPLARKVADSLLEDIGFQNEIARVCTCNSSSID